jgi:hypothetical protein
VPTSPSISKLERFFRIAAGLDIDKHDIKRIQAFVNARIERLIVRAEAVAKANTRDIIVPYDLPITSGMQERMHEFRKIDVDVGLEAELDRIIKRPPTDLDYFEDTERQLPCIGGALTLALACSFKLFNPELKQPMSEHWERAERLFDLVL